MKPVSSIPEMSSIARKAAFSGKRIGFVPTMGALHEGHLSLVREARRENDIVMVSIFVNPIQFGPNEDFNKYPRTIERDSVLLQSENVDYLFIPGAAEMYGGSFETYIDLKTLPQHLCGLKREGHFRGVATVVAKLFNIVMPNTAYFGQKDYQQALIIKRMAADLNFSTDIRVMPIVREKNGLAMSSRNKYLTDKQKDEASIIYRSLKSGEKLILGGEKTSASIIGKIGDSICKNLEGSRIDYISIANPETLSDIEVIEGDALIAAAVYVGNTRLIDNILIIKISTPP
jgi:pantoate--beta-alanine ligase